MALSILDGNQTATTLSTILTGGAHIPAHTVVSLGSQAITDISGAFPATQTIAGTVTAILSYDTIFNDGGDRLNVALGAVAGIDPASWLRDDGGSVPISGTVTANVGGTVNANIRDGSGNNLTSTSIGGLNRLNVTLSSAGSTGITAPSYANLHGGSDGTNLRAILTDTSGRTVVTGSTSILGTSSVTFTSVSIGSCVTHGVVISNSSVTISGVDILSPTTPKILSLSSLDEVFSNNNSGSVLITKICSSNGNPINPISNSELRASPVTIGGSVTVNNSLTIASLPSLAAGTAQIGSVTASISGTVPVSGTFYQATQPVSIASLPASTVTVSSLPASTVTISSLPAISGTVTANAGNFAYSQDEDTSNDGDKGVLIGWREDASGSFRNVSDADPLPISGTVTANLSSVPTHGVTIANSSVTVNGTFYQATQPVSLASLPSLAAGTAQIGSVTASISGTVTANTGLSQPLTDTQLRASSVPVSGPLTDTQLRATAVPVSGTFWQATQPVSIASVTIGNSITIGSFSTSVTARLINPAGTAVTYAEIGTAGNPSIDVLSIQGVTSGTSVPVSISSVTIGAVPSGALTTRFGSVTTANTAQISSAVTNASRKYLFIQNVTTSSNVITIGIGFTPTTTQGIQLSAGGAITFESSYIPTGAVYILSSVTASPFTILEA